MRDKEALTGAQSVHSASFYRERRGSLRPRSKCEPPLDYSGRTWANEVIYRGTHGLKTNGPYGPGKPNYSTETC